MEKNPTEYFIEARMENKNGTLATYHKGSMEQARKSVNGKEATSESLGLWLQYALVCRNPSLFQQGYRLLIDCFMDRDGFIYRKLSPSGKKITHMNSLVDDFRIIDSLFKAAGIWKQPHYLETAGTICKFLNTHNKHKNLLTDFYEKNSGKTSDILTLSFIDSSALKEMKAHGAIEIKTYISMIDLLDHIPQCNGFYANSYNVKEKKFLHDYDIHMMDEALKAFNRAKEGAPPGLFFSFIQKEFKRNGSIYEVYVKDSLLPAVDYESPALYGLLILYCLRTGGTGLAHSLFQRMIQLQGNNTERPYYGGYTSPSKGNVYIFENPMPLLAEEELTRALYPKMMNWN